MKLPVSVSDAIERVAGQLGASKTEVVIALLNEGLNATTQSLQGLKPPKDASPRPKRMCSVAGCGKVHLAKGYCANHYQASRSGKLPKKTAPSPAKTVKLKSKRRARRRSKPFKQ